MHIHKRYENQLAIYVGNPPTYLALKNFLLQVENKTGDICGVMDECLHTDGVPYTYGVLLNSVNLAQTGMALHRYIPGDTGMTLEQELHSVFFFVLDGTILCTAYSCHGSRIPM